MSRWFMTLSYDGSPYHGWQTQPGGVATVQSTLEDALGKALRRPTAIVGAGRTDTGVNARRMVAHFDTDVPFDPLTLPRTLNAITGPTIAVDSVREVDPAMHARFSAVSRTYRYFALTRRSPFLCRYAWQAPPALDFEAMNRAAALLLTASDFTSFSKLHTDAKTNICRVTEARWSPAGNIFATDGLWMFEISADRFLRNMVRAVVGTLVDVGRGKLTISEFADIIEARDRCAAGTSMPAHALFLWDVAY